MASLPRKTGREAKAASSVADDSVRDDWLGLAGYLAEAVVFGDVTVEDARVELAAEATDSAYVQALGRAVEFAATQYGADSLTTALLAWAQSHVAPTANVA